jgi:cell wall-associated NlpC family hydrolase
MKRMGAALVGLVLLILTTVLGTFTASADPVSREQAVQFVIARGLAQRGVPYVWGGGDINGPTAGKPDAAPADPAAAPVTDQSGLVTVPVDPATVAAPAAPVVGFDASGLIQYIFAGVNAKLPRSSGAMYNVGQKVTPEQALPADLIFYGPDGSQSVTMFLGNNQMLEVGDKGVVVSPVRTADMAPYLVRIIA